MKLIALLLSLVSLTSTTHALDLSPDPAGLGVNIHFTQEQEGELDMIRATGFGLVRMDLFWHGIEKTRGVYDFSSYDMLVDGIQRRGMKIILIVDYTNPLYDNNQSVCTEEGRAAYARFAAAAAKHFKGKPVLFEIYNEPNVHFWRPKPNAADYAAMALEACKAIRAEDADAVIIGPALAGAEELDFLETCFTARLLEYWSAVSVHPYRQIAPETVADDYRQIRALIRKYAPNDKDIPIVSGEWGFSDIWASFDRDKQAKYLARQWLANLSNDIPISIYYDWRDDGLDPKEPEHHFGLVEHQPTGNATQPFNPKPSYLAAKTLMEQLKGLKFNKRVYAEASDATLLLFGEGSNTVLVAWASGPRSKVSLPVSAGVFKRTTCTGTADDLEFKIDLPAVELTDEPVYLRPTAANPLLSTLASWESFPRQFSAQSTYLESLANRSLKLQNFTGETRDGIPGGMPGATRVMIEVSSPFRKLQVVRSPFKLSDQITVSQRMVAPQNRYLDVVMHPVDPYEIQLQLNSTLPDGSYFVRVESIQKSPNMVIGDVQLSNAEPRKLIASSFKPDRPTSIDVTLNICRSDPDRVTTFAGEDRRTLSFTMMPLPKDIDVAMEGDEQSAASATVHTEAPPSLLTPKEDGVATCVTYQFGAGWKYACVRPFKSPELIPGMPARMGLWVYGDKSSNILRMRFVDATGQVFQPDGGRLNFEGWKFIEFPMDGSNGGFWHGAQDGKIHYPIKLETLLLIDNASRSANAGKIYFAAPCFYYDPK